MTTRVLIADDEAPARRLVRSYLGGHADVEVVAEAENGLEVVDAIDAIGVDYLLKPFSRERFDRAFARATGNDRGGIARMLASLPRPSAHLERVVVRKGERLFFVATRDILHLSAEGNYVRVHTADGAHLIRGTLADLEARLDPNRFARVHRSGLVNIDAIQEVRTHVHGDFLVVLRNGVIVRLSRRYRERLLGES